MSSSAITGPVLSDTRRASSGTAAAPSFAFNASTGTGMYLVSAGVLGVSTNGAQAMVVDASGNLLVGTTNNTFNAGVGVKLSPNSMGIVRAESTNATSGYHMYSTGAGAFRFYVADGGTIFATSTTITGISDERLKENIRDLDDGLSIVLALKPRKFDWKESKGKNIKNDRGFIAQEFEQVLPDMVEEWKDPAPEGEESYKAVNANLIPTLVKAIQELSAKNEALEARLAALESK